jgi:hypothetical protein
MSMPLDPVFGFPMVVFFFLGFLADVPPPPFPLFLTNFLAGRRSFFQMISILLITSYAMPGALGLF